MRTHETSIYAWQSALAIQDLLLKELTKLCCLYPTEDITSYIETANYALEKNNQVEFQRTCKKFEESLTIMDFEEFVENGCKKRRNNKV